MFLYWNGHDTLYFAVVSLIPTGVERGLYPTGFNS